MTVALAAGGAELPTLLGHGVGSGAPSLSATVAAPTRAWSSAADRPSPGAVPITQEGIPHFFPTVEQAANGPKVASGVLAWGGGPVMHDPTIYLVFWEPSGMSFDTGDTASLGASDALYENTMVQFFDSASNSAWMGIAQQYTDGSGAPGTQVTVGGVFVDTTPYRCGACGASSPLYDSDIQGEVNAIVSAHGTKTGSNAEYFVYLPLGVSECFSSGGQCSFTSFCAYHDWFTSGTVRIYAVMPDLGTSLSTCSLGSSQLQTTYPYGPNGDNYADATANVNSHEFMESITDPEYPNGWDSSSGEIGDLCAWKFGPVPYQDKTDTEYVGHPWMEQYEYSNNISGCYLPPLTPAPKPAATVSLSAATAEAGQAIYINVTGTNTGGFSSRENLTVSIPNTPASSLSVFATTLPTAPSVVPVGTQVRGCYWLCTTTTKYGEVSGSASPWPSASSYTLSVVFHPPAAGSYSIQVKATAASAVATYTTDWSPTTGTLDQDGEYVSATALTVTPGPSISMPLASPASIDVGQTVTFSSTLLSGGTAPDSYSWTASSPALGCSASTTTSLACTPSAAGTYTVTAIVHDSVGGQGMNTSASYTVLPAPALSGPIGTPASVDLGTPVVFLATVANPGSGSDTYAWSESPSVGLGCGPPAALNMSCAPTAAGIYNVTATIVDSNGGTGSSTLQFQVYPTPSVQVPVPTPASVDVGQTVTFNATLTQAGSGGDQFHWSASSSALGCASASMDLDTCLPLTAGSYTVSVQVNDTNGGRANSTSAPFQVFPDPTVRAPTSVDGPMLGIATTFLANLTNPGSGGDTYLWSSTPSGLGCAPSPTASIICTPTSLGTFALTVTVQDSNGGTGKATSTSVIVTKPLTANASASPSSGLSPLSVSFSSTASGGLGPYTFSWHFGDGATSLSAQQAPGHSYSSAGTYQVTLYVNDSAGHTVIKQMTISVAQPTFFDEFPGGMFGFLLLLIVVTLIAAAIVVRRSRRRRGSAPDVGAVTGAEMGAAPMYDPSGYGYAEAPYPGAPPPDAYVEPPPGWDPGAAAPQDPSGYGDTYPPPPPPPDDGSFVPQGPPSYPAYPEAAPPVPGSAPPRTWAPPPP